MSPTMNSLMGFAISMLLVFRPNTAYDLWFEGRKLWGTLVNNSRNLATKLSAILKEDDHGHILSKIDQGKHIPNQVASQLFNRVYHLHQQGKINGDELIILNKELKSCNDLCGACERIRNTPIPFSYSGFIKKLIFIYVITLPFGTDANNLPMGEIAANIKKHVQEILH